MKVALKMLGGSSLLGSAEVINNGCAFLRNIILARLLSKEDFGIAATLALVVSLFELTGKMSFGQQVIQSKTGDNPEFLETTQALQALTGLLDAALIVILCYPLARCFGMQDHLGALMLMAIIPLCAAFASLENYRLSKHMKFLPLVMTDTVPQVVITLAAWPVAAWLRDYRAIVSLLLLKAVFSLVTSHLVAERTYGLCWEARLVRQNLRFGWPLVVSGFLLFGIFQGDRALVAGAYSLSDLGVYAVASTLAMTPCFAIFKIFGTVGLPIFAGAQNDPVRFRRYYALFHQGLAAYGAVFIVGMILGGEMLITLLFGAKYRDAGSLAAWLTIGQAFRILRGAPNCAALALGDTVNTLSANLWRLSGLALAVPIVLFKLDLCWVAIAGGIGEALALSASLVRLRRKQGLPARDCLYPAGLMVALALAAFGAREASSAIRPTSTLALAVLGCAISLAVFSTAFSDLRRASVSLLSAVALRARNILKIGGISGVPADV